jgi:hypothetical protein
MQLLAGTSCLRVSLEHLHARGLERASPGTSRTCVRSGMLSMSCEVMFARWIRRIYFAPSGPGFGTARRGTADLVTRRPHGFDDGARQQLPGLVLEIAPIS